MAAHSGLHAAVSALRYRNFRLLWIGQLISFSGSMMQQAAILWHVNKVFFMGGPQLGELEAGLLANWRGAPFSVIAGGVGTLVATAVIATTVPVLRHYRRDQSAHLDSTVTLLPEASLTEPPTRDSAGV